MPRASRLEEEIKKHLAAEVELTPGTGGVFTVMVGEQVIFSRKKEGSFPAPEEILNRLRRL